MVITNSNVTVVMEVVGEVIGHIGKTLQIPVLVHTTSGIPSKGDVTAYGVGLDYEGTEALVNGVALFRITMPDYTTTCNVMFIYENLRKTVKVNVVDPKNPIDDIAQPDNGSDIIVINLPNDATGNVTVVIDGKNYTATVINGTAVIKISDLPNGTYTGTLTYSGDTQYSNVTKIISVTVKNSNISPEIGGLKLTGNDVTVMYSGSATYRVLVTANGKPVGAGESVTISFNGMDTVVKTDAQGYATFVINTKIKVNTYEIRATYKGVSTTNRVKITHIIKAPNKKVKKSRKVTKIKITLKKVNNKFLKKAKITVKFKGKKYKIKTNKKGVAIWKVKSKMIKKLKVSKKYKYTVTYGKDTVTKKLTIKK